jgi:coenzyme F420-reducing hydrogenase alpha subunit
LLVHKVTLENINGDERINKYHIIAPTEWNFHPEGSLISILQGVVVSRENLMPLLDKLILAIDPCVAYDIRIEE